MNREWLMSFYFPGEEFEVSDFILCELREAHVALSKALEDKRRTEGEAICARKVYLNLLEPELIKKEIEYTAKLRHWTECMNKLNGILNNICTLCYFYEYLKCSVALT
jgi:hypothetical protein